MVAIITVSTTHTYIMTSANTRVLSQLEAQLRSSHVLLFFLLHFPLLAPPCPPSDCWRLLRWEAGTRTRHPASPCSSCVNKALLSSTPLSAESAQRKSWGEGTPSGFSSWSCKPSGLSVSVSTLAGSARTGLGGRAKDAAENNGDLLMLLRQGLSQDLR